MLNRNLGIVIAVIGALLCVALVSPGFRESGFEYVGPIALVLGLLMVFAAAKQ